MISTSDTVVVQSGILEKYAAPRFVCSPRLDADTDVISVEVSIRNSSDAHIRYITFDFTQSQIDAQSTSESGNTAKWLNVVEKQTKSHLEGLNPSATFSIS